MKFREIDFVRLAAMIFVFTFAVFSVFIFVRYGIAAVLPFVLSWGAAFAVRPAAHTLHSRMKLPVKVWSVVLILLLLAAVTSGIYLLFAGLIRQIKELISYLSENPEVITAIGQRITELGERLRRWLHFTDGSAASETVSSMFEKGTSEIITAVGEALPRLAARLAVRIPAVLIFIIVTVISAVYFSLDLERINRAVLNAVPEKARAPLCRMKRALFDIAGHYILAYLTLMAITFVMLLVGFVILRVRYALLISFIFAFIDLLPILGVGTMLLPWGIYCLATGNIRQGIGLLVLYAVIAVARQFIEPKLLGDRLGIHPLLMLVYIYAGLSIFGFAGIFIGPVAGIVIRSVSRDGDQKNLEKEG